MDTETNDLNIIAFAERLNKRLDELGYPPKYKGRYEAVAKDFNVSSKATRKWLEGDSLPKTTRMMDIARKYRIPFELLATGQTTFNESGETAAAKCVPILDSSQARAFIDDRRVPTSFETIDELQSGTAHVAFGLKEESQQFEPAISKGATYYILPMIAMVVAKLPDKLVAVWVGEHILVGRIKQLAQEKLALVMPDKSEIALDNGQEQIIGLVTHIVGP